MTRKFAKELAEAKQVWATVNETRERAMESEKRKIRCSWEGCWRQLHAHTAMVGAI